MISKSTAAMEWTASPSAGVWRKRLEHVGPPEAGRVTSIVRYDPGSAFSAHPHPDGEEILVLEGTFVDERGAHPAGTFMLNPEGFSHSPSAPEGCVLFVKLRQYRGERPAVRVDTTDPKRWLPGREVDMRVCPLYASQAHGERVQIVELVPGADMAAEPIPDGREIYVLSGVLEDDAGTWPAGSWLKLAPGATQAWRTQEGARFYLREPAISL